MSHSETVRELASILNPQNEARPTVLLGAGASFSSGVPLADESVKRIARRYYAERIPGTNLRPMPILRAFCPGSFGSTSRANSADCGVAAS
jgi:hypothetical protein